MKYLAYALLLICSLTVISPAFSEEQTPPNTPQATTAPFGKGKRADYTVKFQIPKAKEPVFRIPAGHMLLPDTLKVTSVFGKTLYQPTTNTVPGKGEFRMISDYIMLFSPGDARATVQITYAYLPSRVAILPVVNQSAIDYITGVTKEALQTNLTKLGFETVPDIEVEGVVRDLKFNVDALATAAPTQATEDSVKALAKRLNVTNVVSTVVGTGNQKGETGFVFVGNVAVPYSGTGVTANLGILMLNGESGKQDFSKAKSNSKSDPLSTRYARTEMIKGMVKGIFTDFYGAVPE